MGKPAISYWVMTTTYITYTIVILIGHIRDQFGKIFTPWNYRAFYMDGRIPQLYTTLESFFIRRLYQRICDCWNRPIIGIPGKTIHVKERVSHDDNLTFDFTGKLVRSLNFGSYNYLGFADEAEENISACLEAADRYNINYACASAEHMPCDAVRTLEREIADFLYQEDAVVFSMGFGTNTWVLSALTEDALVFSDINNHTSLICGFKLTNAHVVIFEHNNMADLEHKLKHYITQGMPETHRSWKRIFVVVEGIYSMEGTMAKLPELVELKKKYNFYIYMDEAHSIGAIGKTGRGVCEHLHVDFNDVDILMGTFSKSFCAAGGYVAGSKSLISYLRAASDGCQFAEQLPPIVATQILRCLRRIIAEPERVARLLENTKYMRHKLRRLGFQAIGDPCSPVVPILICTPGKLGIFSRLCLKFGLAVVVVGYPATPILESRVRLCVSASHTKLDIDRALDIIDSIGTILGLKV